MKLTVPKLWLPTIAALALIGCANPGPPLPPSLELPKPVSDLRATRKGDKVYLFWTVPTQTEDRQNIVHRGPTRICRALGKEIVDCGNGVGEISPSQFPVTLPAKKKRGETLPKVEARFVDTLPPSLLQPDPSDVISYAVSAYNSHNRSAGFSNQVQVPAIPSMPPPANFDARLTADGVTLSWSPLGAPHEPDGVSHVVRIYRRLEGGNTDAIAGEAPIDATTLTDHGFGWEKTYNYRATVVAEIAQPGKGELPLEGDDTPSVKVIAHDIFPPAVPTGLQAVATGVGQQPGIDLVWAPDVEPDLAGYNIYRHEEGGQPEKINEDLVKSPSYRDTGVVAGHTYSYSVSAIDARGNESARSEEAHETMPQSP
jgi:hypothetical protein